MKKINIAIIFGGRSAEHEVSLQSARNVYHALNKRRYNPIIIGIDKSGKWLLDKDAGLLIAEGEHKSVIRNRSNEPVAVKPGCNGAVLSLSGNKKEAVIEVAFPVLHGPFGEDGTVQGLLKLADIPFVGAGVLGSAVGMDKDVMKRLLRDADLPVSKFIVLKSDDPVPGFESIVKRLGLPFFVKPANLGSSVGISKVHDKSEYGLALKTAFSFDLKILIEEFIEGRELECAVLGNDKPRASVVGEIISGHEFYSYDAKYIDEKGAKLEIPAKIAAKKARDIQRLAVETFTALSCEGMGRIDFFMKKDGSLLINEINTIPGFTKVSMYPKLWEASGIPYEELIERLISLAFERFDKEKKLK
ncbi:MAG: D-alanine--D-alanine ligase [Deltaproteobacteria bacterium]|nr:D-alanine--D-alanine ligase [Deltaproteobacteria bacterium]